MNDKSSSIVAGECVGMPSLLISKTRMGCNFKYVAPATPVDLTFVDWIGNCGIVICFMVQKLPGSSLVEWRFISA